jgi:hypothetical protein
MDSNITFLFLVLVVSSSIRVVPVWCRVGLGGSEFIPLVLIPYPRGCPCFYFLDPEFSLSIDLVVART